MSKSTENKPSIREKIIGLGKDSIRKSYYPQLQEHIQELELQKKAIEQKNIELTNTMLELKSTQEQLKKSENKFRTFFENSYDAILIQNSKHKIIDCNATALQILHCTRDELINKTPEDLSPRFQPDGLESKKKSKHKMNLALKGTPQVFEWALYGENKSYVHALISLNRFELDGSVYLQSIIRDITNIKRLEQELLTATIQTEENERTRFAKELHDGVGPILSTVKLYFQWLAETDDLEQKEIIIKKGNSNIAEAIKALKEVSNNLSPHILLNYGLIEGLKQHIERITEVGKIAIQLDSNLNKRLNKEIEVTLYRVLIELINNTLKHAEANKISISIQVEKNNLYVAYSDDGLGLDIIKALNSKSGLGIYNIKNRIKNLGGSIDFDSEPNIGIKVKISLNLDFPYGI